jgi:predicted DNA-binding ribbon-helix-helix protein
MKSRIAKRSIVIAGHKTSISLEDAFWNEMKMIANERHMTLSQLVGSIDLSRKDSNLSSAIRLFVLSYYTNEAERQPHTTRQQLHPAVA